MEVDDRQLILRAQQGDVLAFEQLVFRHDRKVLSLAAQYVSSADDAKDIYQEVFIRVYRGLKKFQFRSEFSTWLHRVTVNVCLTHRSRQKQRAHYVSLHEDPDSEDPHGVLQLQAENSLTDQQAQDSEISAHVQSALDRLSPKQRMVFTLRHFEGHKLKEIAGMMDCTEGTVKRYLFSATRKMRNELRGIL
ncbi:RNA polymerase sigma factor [bacterium]|nr:MAG: RNA polymerase sigma factor [bacterium]